MKLLHIDSSARENSISRRLTAQFIEVWKRNHAVGDVIYRDLATTVIPRSLTIGQRPLPTQQLSRRSKKPISLYRMS